MTPETCTDCKGCTFAIGTVLEYLSEQCSGCIAAAAAASLPSCPLDEPNCPEGGPEFLIATLAQFKLVGCAGAQPLLTGGVGLWALSNL